LHSSAKQRIHWNRRPAHLNLSPHDSPVVQLAPSATPNAASSAAAALSHSTNCRGTVDRHRQATFPFVAAPKLNRASLFTLATLARDRTSSAIASLAEPSIRRRASIGGTLRTAQSHSAADSNHPNSSASQAELRGRDNTRSKDNTRAWRGDSSSIRSPTPPAPAPAPPTPPHLGSEKRRNAETLASSFSRETNPPSQAYANTRSETPAPVLLPLALHNKMHQTSSRLLRMTEDDRPFTRDFKDLFATLVVSLPLGAHRVRLTRVEHTFLSEEAINNLGSLKFSQSNRMPDPKDPSRIVTTTTTTTFSMAREMARSVCQRCLDARFIESADGKHAKEFTLKGSVWQLTPKGIHLLERFCAKNGIQQKHVADLVNSPRNTMQLVILEREQPDDKLSADRGTIEVIFRRFIGQHGPNVKNSTSSADSDSLSEYKDGIAGVKMAHERKIGSPPRTLTHTFTGKAATDWLMDCCTTVDRREPLELATLFLEQELIACVQQDKAYLNQFSPPEREGLIFQPTKHAIYQMTRKGRDVINMVTRERPSDVGDPASSAAALARAGVSRDSNTQKLDKILNDASLRLLFRENLRDTHCEENLSFYLDVDEFLKSCKLALQATAAPRANHGSSSKAAAAPPPPLSASTLDSVKETMASAYGIYNAFLAPGSPCELNIDHLLRNQLATRMTKAVGQDSAMIESLREVTKLFEEAQLSVFKLMASDSVPKFIKSSKYELTLRCYDFDSIAPRTNAGTLPEASLSKSTR
ncbi:RGS-domain-containing protein, partial [Diplocarpon rosae]